MENFKKGFIEFDFCKECKNYIECKNSEFGLKLLEKVMILKALIKQEGSMIQKKYEQILNESKIDKKELEDFIKDKKRNCIYFN